jgi:hypothetical protein
MKPPFCMVKPIIFFHGLLVVRWLDARRSPETQVDDPSGIFHQKWRWKFRKLGLMGICVYIYILGLIVIIYIYILIDWDVSWESNGMFQIFHDDTVIPDQQQSYGCDGKWYRNLNREHNAQASSVLAQNFQTQPDLWINEDRIYWQNPVLIDINTGILTAKSSIPAVPLDMFFVG